MDTPTRFLFNVSRIFAGARSRGATPAPSGARGARTLTQHCASRARLAREDGLGPRAERLIHVELALERHHDVARVLREAVNVVERRDDEALGLREDRHQAEHRRAAVVHLDKAAARLLLLGLLREDVERLVEVEEDLRAVALDRRVVARLAARAV